MLCDNIDHFSIGSAYFCEMDVDIREIEKQKTNRNAYGDAFACVMHNMFTQTRENENLRLMT